MQTDYSNRIASRFLEDRARLGAAIHSLSALAGESLSTLSAASRLQTVQSELRRPFVFLLTGEANAGKAPLIDALFGRAFCEPVEAPTCVLRYGEESRDIVLGPGVVERRRPLPFLRDFQLIDSAEVSASVLEAPQAFTQKADLMIFVLSARDPWNGHAWQIAAEALRANACRIIIALQECDERPAMEVKAIAEHVERLAQSRLGEKAPVFAVSARKALLARTSGLDRNRLWRESGFEPLERSIDEIISGALGRGGDLPAAAGVARTVLKGISDDVQRLAEDVVAERAAIASADELILRDREACDLIIAELEARLEKAAAQNRRQGGKLLQTRSQRGGNPWTRSGQRALDAAFREGANAEVEIALNAMISRFQEGADALLAVCDRPAQPIGDERYREATEAVGELCRRLAEEVGLTLAEHLSQDDIDVHVQARFKSAVHAMCTAVAAESVGLLSTVGMGVSWGFGPAIWAGIGAVAATALSLWKVRREQRQAILYYETKMPAFHAVIIDQITAAFAGTATACGEQLRGALEPLNAHCASRHDRVTPIRQQIENLEATFRAVA